MDKACVDFVKPSARKFDSTNLLTPVVGHCVICPPGSVPILDEGSICTTSALAVVHYIFIVF